MRSLYLYVVVRCGKDHPTNKLVSKTAAHPESGACCRYIKPDDKTIVAEIQGKVSKGEMAKPRMHSALAGVDAARRLSRMQSRRVQSLGPLPSRGHNGHGRMSMPLFARRVVLRPHQVMVARRCAPTRRRPNTFAMPQMRSAVQPTTSRTDHLCPRHCPSPLRPLHRHAHWRATSRASFRPARRAVCRGWVSRPSGI